MLQSFINLVFLNGNFAIAKKKKPKNTQKTPQNIQKNPHHNIKEEYVSKLSA